MLRLTLTEFADHKVFARFDTGDAVTITVYNRTDNVTEVLTSSLCSEIGGTGIFEWNFSNLTTQPTYLTQYIWVMSNGASEQDGVSVAGGYPETILAKLNELIVTPGGLMNYENPWFVGNLPAGGTVTIKVYDSLGVEEALDDSDCDEFVPGYYRWSTVNMTTYPGTVGSYFWVMVDSDSGRTTWGVGPIGTPEDIGEVTADAVWDAARADHTDVGSFGESVPADVIMLRGDATAAGFLKKQYDGTGAVDPTFPATQAQADALITAVGTPVALDSGDASIAGMLTKIADNNGGEDFGAGTDSLHEIALSSGGGATPAQIWAYLLAGDEGTGSAAAALMAAVRTAPVPLVKVNDIFNLRTDIEKQLLSVGIDPTQNLRWRWKTVDRFGNAVTGFPSTVMLSGTELFAQFVGGDLNHSPYKFTLYVRQWNRPEGPWLVADYGIMLGEL